MGKKLIIGIIFIGIIIVATLGTWSYFIFFNDSSEPQKIKIDSLKIVDVNRDCTTINGNFGDITIQTTIDVDVIKNEKNSIKINAFECNLKIGSKVDTSFSLNKFPTPDPYVDGIENSGLHLVTGGELSGDKSEVLTFCCQEECDSINLEICSNL